MKELIQQYDLLQALRKSVRFTFLVLYLMITLPYFYNLGSSVIGCPVYELRTGSVCFDILNP